MDVRVRLWRKLSAEELMLLNCGVGEDSWESLGLQGDPTSPSWRRSVLNIHWKDWCWSWKSNTLATSCKKLTHLKGPWCWEGLRVGGEGDDRGWDGWMASPTQWTWVWVDSWSWWWTGRPGVLQFMGSKRVRHDWVTELNWRWNCQYLGSAPYSGSPQVVTPKLRGRVLWWHRCVNQHSMMGLALAAQCLIPWPFNAGGEGLTPGQGPWSHMPHGVAKKKQKPIYIYTHTHVVYI